MTDLLANPNFEPIAANAGGFNIGPRMVDEPDLAPSILTTMRAVGPDVLRLDRPNQFEYRPCTHDTVQGWAEGCSRDGVTPLPAPLDKCSMDCWEWSPEFLPFTFYVVAEYDCIHPNNDPQAEANAAIERFSAFALSREIDSAPISGNPSLRSLGRDLTPADGPVSITQGLTTLLRAYRRMGQAGFTLHLPYELIPVLESRNLIRQRGGLLVASGGITVNPGPGLSGVAPNNMADGSPKLVPPDEGLPDQGVYAIYATKSTVEYRLGETQQYGGGTQVHERTNSMLAEGLRMAAYRFSPECVFAVQINASSSACGSC